MTEGRASQGGLLVAPVVLMLDALALGVLHADLRGVTGAVVGEVV